MKRERQRQLDLAPAGQKELRRRVLEKKRRAQELMAGVKRHEQALKEMNHRRAEGLSQVRAKPLPSTKGYRGAGAGVHTNNKYMQEFTALKRGHQKRRGKGRGITQVQIGDVVTV